MLKSPDALKASRIKAIHVKGVRLGRVGEGRDNIGARPLILLASVNEELGRGKVEGFLSFSHSPSSIFFPAVFLAIFTSYSPNGKLVSRLPRYLSLTAF